MYVIRATGADRPYLQIFREQRTDCSHTTYWAFTGVRLAARHFQDRDAAAVVKARLVNLMLCSGRYDFARTLEVVPAIPGQGDELGAEADVIAAGSSLDEAERQPSGPTIWKRIAAIAGAFVACVLTLAVLPGCAAPKVAAEAAYRSEARSLAAGEVVAGVRVEWN